MTAILAFGFATLAVIAYLIWRTLHDGLDVLVSLKAAIVNQNRILELDTRHAKMAAIWQEKFNATENEAIESELKLGDARRLLDEKELELAALKSVVENQVGEISRLQDVKKVYPDFIKLDDGIYEISKNGDMVKVGHKSARVAEDEVDPDPAAPHYQR